MFLLLIVLASPVARADSLHLPIEMRQKVDVASQAISDGMRAARQKTHQAGEESNVAKAVFTDLGKIWVGVKTKSRYALLYLDHELHKHVLGPEDRSDARP